MVLTISRCKDNKNVARKQHFFKKMQSRNNIFIPNSGVSCNSGVTGIGESRIVVSIAEGAVLQSDFNVLNACCRGIVVEPLENLTVGAGGAKEKEELGAYADVVRRGDAVVNPVPVALTVGVGITEGEVVAEGHHHVAS